MRSRATSRRTTASRRPSERSARRPVIERASLQRLTARILLGVLALCLGGAAQAQRKHMPVRTQEVPDTESGRPAASAERPTFKGRLLIYGPPSLPVTPPAAHVAPAPAQAEEKPAAPAPVASPAPAAPAPIIAAPAPAPVVTPTQPAEAPVATPLPAPAPPPPVAAPAPEPKPAPVAAPTPAPEPKPAPVAAPTPAPQPAVPAAPVARDAAEPRREPIVRPEAIAPAPAAAARPPAPRQDVAMAAPSSAATPEAPVPIDLKVIESIFTCLAPGLPQDWKRAWVEITDQGGGKEKVSKFRYTNLRNDDEGEALVPCNAQELTRRIVGLNDKLPPDRRGWNRALLVIESDGEYEMSYEYPK